MEFGVDYDVKFNDMKSVAMRVDPCILALSNAVNIRCMVLG